MALKLAEMNAFLQKRQAEDEHLQEEIQDAFKELNKSVQSSYVASFPHPAVTGPSLAVAQAVESWVGVRIMLCTLGNLCSYEDMKWH